MAVTITRSIWVDDDGTGQTGTVINQALHTTLYNEIDTALAKVAQLAGGNTFTVGPHIFQTGGVTRLQIPTSGIVQINTTNQFMGQLSVGSTPATLPALAVQNLDPNASFTFVGFYNNAVGVAGSIAQSGTTGVVYLTTSDARLKTDAGRATDLAALRAVVVHDFTWTADGVRDRGVFAQDARDLYPRAVSEGTDDLTESGTLARPWMTDYSKFVPDLIVGWQQHDAALTELRAILAAVKG